jgi:hypothetical protein
MQEVDIDKIQEIIDKIEELLVIIEGNIKDLQGDKWN